MNDKYKAKFARLKEQTKKNAPEIVAVALGAAGAVGWYLAGQYKKQLIELQIIDPDAWPTIEVHPDLLDQMAEGAILKVRRTRGSMHGRTGTYVQMTVKDEFSDEQNEDFAEVQGKNRPDAI
jgi:hypothetical protein